MTEVICGVCKRKFDSNVALSSHFKAKHEISPEEQRINSQRKIRKYTILAALAIAVVIFSYTIYVRAQRPGAYDDFAKCLTEKGAIMYGNDFCEYTSQQRNYFGKSERYLNYVKCANKQALCDQKGVKVTPTWEIGGKMYPQVQTFEKLSLLTGCKI